MFSVLLGCHMMASWLAAMVKFLLHANCSRTRFFNIYTTHYLSGELNEYPATNSVKTAKILLHATSYLMSLFNIYHTPYLSVEPTENLANNSLVFLS